MEELKQLRNEIERLKTENQRLRSANHDKSIFSESTLNDSLRKCWMIGLTVLDIHAYPVK